jgi:two-component system response regulator/two-component system chemotaxis response regulator CheY
MLYDFNLRMATNGMEAVEKFKSFEPDIVLMDIVMPVIDGIEATKEILRINKEAKVIAITAYERQRGMEMIRAGAVGILEKPFRKKDLIELINNYI